MPSKKHRTVELSATKAKPTDDAPQPARFSSEKNATSSPSTLRAGKRIPGMARRSSRNWTQPVRTRLEPEPEPEPPRREPPRRDPPRREPERQSDVAPSPERRPEPEAPGSPAEPPNMAELMAASKELESDEDDEDPGKVFASALIGAASEGDMAEVERLLGVADINTAFQPSEDLEEDWHGATALIAAARFGQTAVVSFLLEAGADYLRTDAAGRSALDWANQGDEEGSVDAAAVLGAWAASAVLRDEISVHETAKAEAEAAAVAPPSPQGQPEDAAAAEAAAAEAAAARSARSEALAAAEVPTAPPVMNARAEIDALYREHNPDKLGGVDALVAKFGEENFLTMVRKKYGGGAAE